MACFCPPYAKVERYSYPVPTPGAIRGALSAIYEKPFEFFWQVEQIEVMHPVSYFFCKTNEVKNKLAGCKSIDPSEVRTQRTTMYLKDVAYRVTASPVVLSSDRQRISAVYSQIERRVKKGQCFYQPYLGLRECSCYFAPADLFKEPIPDSMSLGIMLYDVFDPWKQNKEASVSWYPAEMKNGVVKVPRYNDPCIFRVRGGAGNAAGII